MDAFEKFIRDEVMPEQGTFGLNWELPVEINGVEYVAVLEVKRK